MSRQIRLAASLTPLTPAASRGVTVTQRSATADHYLFVLPAGGSLRGRRRHAAATPRVAFLQVYHLCISAAQITKTINAVLFNLDLSVLTRTGLQEELISNGFTIAPTENRKVNRGVGLNHNVVSATHFSPSR